MPRPSDLLAALEAPPGVGRIAAWRAALAALRQPGREDLGPVRARLQQLQGAPLATFDEPMNRRLGSWVTVVDDATLLVSSFDEGGARRLSLEDGRFAPAIGEFASAPLLHATTGVSVARRGGRLVLAAGHSLQLRPGARPDGAPDLLAVARTAAPLRGEPATPRSLPTLSPDPSWSGRSMVGVVAASPDGRRIAFGGAFPGIGLLDVDAGKVERWLVTPDPTHPSTRALAFDATGARLAAGGGTGQEGWVRVYDLDRPEHEVAARLPPVQDLLFERRAILAVSTAALSLVDPESGEVRPVSASVHRATFQARIARGPDGAVWTAAQDHVVAWSWDGTLARPPVPGARRPRPIHVPVWSLDGSPDGALVVVGGYVAMVRGERPPTIEVWAGLIPPP